MLPVLQQLLDDKIQLDEGKSCVIYISWLITLLWKNNLSWKGIQVEKFVIEMLHFELLWALKSL